jgi:hypothetical protein
MGTEIKTTPVTDSVPKVNDDLAVGADLKFQRRWWKLETVVWWLFGALVLLDIVGVFGRGPAANAERKAADSSITVKYERIERVGTPSKMTIQFGPETIHDGKVQLLVSQSLVEELGNQRVIPQPAVSQIGGSKILYTFPASVLPTQVQLGLEPAKVGRTDLSVQVPGCAEVKLDIFVMP